MILNKRTESQAQYYSQVQYDADNYYHVSCLKLETVEEYNSLNS